MFESANSHIIVHNINMRLCRLHAHIIIFTNHKMKKIVAVNPRVMVVHNLTELANAEFGCANLINFPRNLKGDFNGLARKLGDFLFVQENTIDHHPGFNITRKNFGSFHQQGLEDFRDKHKHYLTKGEQTAINEIINDLIFANQGSLEYAHAQLRVIGYGGYHDTVSERIKQFFANIATEKKKYVSDVYKFHTDGDPDLIEFVSEKSLTKGGLSCCYNPPVTQNLLNEDAEYLDQIYFAGKSGAKIREDVKIGDIFRHAAFVKDKTFAPFIHRAPRERLFGPPRLLLRT